MHHIRLVWKRPAYDMRDLHSRAVVCRFKSRLVGRVHPLRELEPRDPALLQPKPERLARAVFGRNRVILDDISCEQVFCTCRFHAIQFD